MPAQSSEDRQNVRTEPERLLLPGEYRARGQTTERDLAIATERHRCAPANWYFPAILGEAMSRWEIPLPHTCRSPLPALG